MFLEGNKFELHGVFEFFSNSSLISQLFRVGEKSISVPKNDFFSRG